MGAVAFKRMNDNLRSRGSIQCEAIALETGLSIWNSNAQLQQLSASVRTMIEVDTV